MVRKDLGPRLNLFVRQAMTNNKAEQVHAEISKGKTKQSLESRTGARQTPTYIFAASMSA